jgi:tRNA(Ile)-lysidine synthase
VLADAAVAALGPPGVILLHVDHGASASAGAAAHCARFAAARGLELRTAHITVPAGASWEAQARAARYHALRSLTGDTDELVLTAHTASDQAETVLLQLLRGTGPAGLAGVARRRGPFLRPLLEVSRTDVLTYLDTAATDLVAWHDPMNEDPRFTRVRVRKELVPALHRINPQAEAALCRLAAAAAEERVVLDAAAIALVRGAHVPTTGGLSCAAIAAAPPPIAKRALAAWLRGHREISARHLDALVRLCRGKDAGTRGIDLPGGRVERVYGELLLVSAPVGPDVLAAAPVLVVDGPDAPYRVRLFAPGDRMRPVRLRGRSRKLSDLFIDLRIPRALRARARVVERPDGTIVWAEHVGAAFDCDVTVR